MGALKLVLAACIAVLTVVPGALASRPSTYLERVTIMDAFNVPGRSFASKCVEIRVSTADARYALLTSPRSLPAACSRAREAGNGFVLFVRASATALRWRNIFEGSLSAPCSVPRAVRLDLLGSAGCG